MPDELDELCPFTAGFSLSRLFSCTEVPIVHAYGFCIGSMHDGVQTLTFSATEVANYGHVLFIHYHSLLSVRPASSDASIVALTLRFLALFAQAGIEF